MVSEHNKRTLNESESKKKLRQDGGMIEESLVHELSGDTGGPSQGQPPTDTYDYPPRHMSSQLEKIVNTKLKTPYKPEHKLYNRWLQDAEDIITNREEFIKEFMAPKQTTSILGRTYSVAGLSINDAIIAAENKIVKDIRDLKLKDYRKDETPTDDELLNAEAGDNHQFMNATKVHEAIAFGNTSTEFLRSAKEAKEFCNMVEKYLQNFTSNNTRTKQKLFNDQELTYIEDLCKKYHIKHLSLFYLHKIIRMLQNPSSIYTLLLQFDFEKKQQILSYRLHRAENNGFRAATAVASRLNPFTHRQKYLKYKEKYMMLKNQKNIS